MSGVYITADQFQQQVIDSAAKDILVLAGAGSGKTFTLLSRIKNLINIKNVRPDNILVLTFTRVAAENLRTKYIEMQNSMYDVVPDFMTFHAFCYKVMQENIEVCHKLGYDTVPDIITDTDMHMYQLRAKDDVSCNLSDKKLSKPTSLSGKELRRYELYVKRLNSILHKENVIDYDSLNEKVCELFRHKDDSVSSIVQRYKYLFVDEFQDTDKHQFNFVMSMNDSNRVVCGDVLQNIYQFRGCSSKPMKQLYESDNWATYRLPVNYRSTKQICSYVNSFSSMFNHNKKYRIELQSQVQGPSVRLWDINTGNLEYEDVVRYVNVMKEKGTVAVLCRTNKKVQEYSDIFNSSNIDFTTVKSNEYSLNILNSCRDSEFYHRFLISNMSDSEYILYHKLNMSGSKDEFIFNNNAIRFNSCFDIIKDVSSVKNIINNNDIDECIFMICNMFAISLPSSNIDTVEELFDYVYNRVASDVSHQVYLGTIHSVKGLEYDSVVVIDVDGPSFRIKSEENQNLLYTACTRAKRNLIVFYGNK